MVGTTFRIVGGSKKTNGTYKTTTENKKTVEKKKTTSVVKITSAPEFIITASVPVVQNQEPAKEEEPKVKNIRTYKTTTIADIKARKEKNKRDHRKNVKKSVLNKVILDDNN